MSGSDPRLEQADLPPARGTEQFAAWLATTYVVYLLVAVVIVAVVLSVVLWPAVDAKPDDLKHLAALFVDGWGRYLKPEPIERLAYLTGIAVTFPAVILGAIISGRSGNADQRIAAVGSCVIALMLSITFLKSDFLHTIFQESQSSDTTIWLTAFLACLLITAIITLPYRNGLRLNQLLSRATFSAIFTYVTVCLAFLRLRSPGSLFEDMHFEAVYYSISQVLAGMTLYADLPSQYGMYAEILAPLLRVTGYNVAAIVTVFSVLQYLSYVALIVVVFLCIKSNVLRLLCCFSLLLFVGSNWLFLTGLWRGYEYFQIWPIRLLFPSLVLLGFVVARRRGLRISDCCVLSVLAGIGVLWNLDWGIPAWGGLVAVALMRLLLGSDSERPSGAAFLALSALIPMGVVALFAGFLALKSGDALDWTSAAKYQRIFFLTGFGMLPLPLVFHPWMAVIAIYLYGLVYSARKQIIGRASFHSEVLLYLSVLGTGIFTYYQGRSHDIVLTFVLWPALIIVFILVDQTLRAVRLGRLNWVCAAATVPPIVFGFSAANAMIAGTPRLWQQTTEVVKELQMEADSAWRTEVDFVTKRVGSSRSAVVISPGQALILGETGLASATQGPGIVELLLKEDQDRLLNRILASSVDPLFIQEDEPGRVPDDYQALLRRYSIIDRSGSGLLQLKPRVSATSVGGPTSHQFEQIEPK